jgi:hypothetical protein
MTKFLRHPVAVTVREVGTFPSHASPLVKLELGEGRHLFVPVTPDEARALACKLNQIISVRIAIEDDEGSRDGR